MKTYALSLTSAFSTTSLLKARILMLYRKPSAKFALAKFGFALPALALCVLITAFTQRERILPASLLAETNKVAQRLTQEVQKAFLPVAVSEVQNTDNPILPTIPVEGQARLEILPARGVSFVATEPTVFVARLDTTTPKKVQKLIGDFTFLKSYNLDDLYWGNRRKLKFSYIFTKNNFYTIQFVDWVKKEPVLNPAKVSVVSSNGEKMEVIELSGGIGFRSEATGMYHLEFEKGTSQTSHLAILSFSRTGLVTSAVAEDKVYAPLEVLPYLTDAQGYTQNLNKKVSLKKPLKVIIPPADGASFEIESMLVAIFRKGKLVVQKGFYDYRLDLTDLEIKRGDGIQITLEKVMRKNTDGTTPNATLNSPYITFFAK